MFSYIVRRLAFGALTIVGVSIVVFVVMRVLPGDPLVAIFGTEGFTKLTPAQRDNYMAALGLSDPLPLQYWHWVLDIARGQFGHSFFRSESVADTIARRGPLTAEIAFLSVVLSWVVGIPVAGTRGSASQQYCLPLAIGLFERAIITTPCHMDMGSCCKALIPHPFICRGR